MTDITSMEKKCVACDLTKPVSEFAVHKGKPHGRCKPCKRDYDRSYYAANQVKMRKQRKITDTSYVERNRQHVLEYLQSHPCIDCGISDIRVLEFDHRDRSTKKAEVARMVIDKFSLQAIIDEIAKCDVRCANCHRIKTGDEFGLWRSKYLPV